MSQLNLPHGDGISRYGVPADAISVPADSAAAVVKFAISIPRETCTNAKAKYSSSVVPPDPSVHFYHCRHVADGFVSWADAIVSPRGRLDRLSLFGTFDPFTQPPNPAIYSAFQYLTPLKLKSAPFRGDCDSNTYHTYFSPQIDVKTLWGNFLQTLTNVKNVKNTHIQFLRVYWSLSYLDGD